ncbi:hypothetical protein WJN01_14790 [Flavobacteriaceae bacterium SZ-1-7]|uniref:hypothetical protein n=1 Tax=Tamlana sedimenti TaxID=3134126 RepID=UPI0031295213
MSFGVVQSAIVSIRSNLGLLSKRERLNKTLSGSGRNKYETKSPSASPYELKKLRNRILRENKAIRIKQLVFVITIVALLIFGFLYYFI